MYLYPLKTSYLLFQAVYISRVILYPWTFKSPTIDNMERMRVFCRGSIGKVTKVTYPPV